MAWHASNSNRVIDRRCVSAPGLAAIGLTLLAGLHAGPAAGADPPFGLQARTPWTSTRLVGSPEPPSPYTVEKTFTKLTWKSPIYMAEEPGTDRLWVVLAAGEKGKGPHVVRIKDDPAADSAEDVLAIPGRLIYSVCFHPDYTTNGFVYVFSNGPTAEPDRKDRVSRFTVGRKTPQALDPKSEEVVIEWKSAGHDGGDMAFGKDGMLYITTGDGTSDSDGWDSGQTLDDLLGSVLRIDVNHRDGTLPYAVPRDNPFVNTPGARPEIWAYGLRNPWRMCADVKTGQVWAGNNGQDLWETAHLVRRGENYGWSVYEGNHPFYLERRRGPTPHVAPTIEHSHAEFRSLTGGVVYRGGKLPGLDGVYIYGDYSSGRIWGMKHDGERPLWHRELADTSLQIAAFRVDHRGDLLIADHGGGLYRLVPRPHEARAAPFPTLLSQTGLFASTGKNQADPGVIPYSVNAPGWNDGARAERFMAVPGTEKVGFEAGRGWTFPDGTALVQTLSIDREPGQAGPPVRLETRVLLRQQGEWEGYSYRWNPEQTDATLVGKNGQDAPLGGRQTWRFPARSECM
ncbi:MAG: PQQ-dependent sugar dehydrogenase, partial [Planctomycetia bacterium]|nr:PQQ-dependent sugar dehydrogenase [Planctomycetia bacterium]